MKAVALLALLSALFAPPRGHLRAEYFFVAVLLILILSTRGRGTLRPVFSEVVCLVGLSASILLSIIAYSLSSTTFHWRDMMSVVRYLALIAILISTAGITFRDVDRSRLMLVLCILATIGGLLSIVQFYDIGGTNALFLTLYRGSDPMSEAYFSNFVLGDNSRRVIGTAGNPNIWAYILTMLSVFVAARIMIGRRYRWIPILFVLIVANLMTGSRSSAVGFLVAFLAIVAVGASQLQTRRGALIAVAGTLLVLPISFLIYTSTINVEENRYRLDNIESLFLRFQLWSDTIVEYSDHLVLGKGPAKSERRAGTHDAKQASFRDNIFVSLYAEQGVVGLSLLIALLVVMWNRLRAAIRSASSDLLSLQIAAGMTGVFLAFIVFNVAADALFAVQPATIFMLLYGISISATTNADPRRMSVPQPEDSWLNPRLEPQPLFRP